MRHVSIRYTERLAEAGIEPSVGSVGDSCDNALAEPINGLCTRRKSFTGARGGTGRPWNWPRSIEWTGSTTSGCRGPIGNIPLTEAVYHQQQHELAMAA